ncbi:hypothetical protein Taro_042838 [Colocasia esculenta]|uniref:Uncharacterized protein n=1 Tax=Colocasia esculenta TaxID=4460 RepID=A0A843WPW1_COLES|nr:hypothetical protein [Colocasia esculenta]
MRVLAAIVRSRRRWLSRSGRDKANRCVQVATHRQVALRPSQRTDRPRQAEPAFGVTRGSGRDMSARRNQIATVLRVATPPEAATHQAVAISGGGPNP